MLRSFGYRRRETEPELLGLQHSDVYESTSHLVRSPSNASSQNRYVLKIVLKQRGEKGTF